MVSLPLLSLLPILGWRQYRRPDNGFRNNEIGSTFLPSLACFDWILFRNVPVGTPFFKLLILESMLKLSLFWPTPFNPLSIVSSPL